jgi:hypothetical protein
MPRPRFYSFADDRICAVPGFALCRTADRYLHRAADVPGNTCLHVHLWLGRDRERIPDVVVRNRSSTPGLPLFEMGRHAGGNHRVHAVRHAPAPGCLLADRALADRGRKQPWRATGAHRPAGDPSRSAAGARRRRKPLPAADGERVRHCPLHWSQGRHHPSRCWSTARRSRNSTM